MSRNPVHPGEILADELAELGMTATALARELRVPRERMSRIVRGARAVTGDTALRLGHWFGTSAAFWMNLQSAHDIAVAQRQNGGEIALLPRRMLAAGEP